MDASSERAVENRVVRPVDGMPPESGLHHACALVAENLSELLQRASDTDERQRICGVAREREEFRFHSVAR